jgi:hypothetical protein
MFHAGANRSQDSLGKKLVRFFNYRRAKKLCGEINRDMTFFEARFLKSRFHHA